MYYISCYASATDLNACMFLSYKSRAAAEKRAEKARKTFGRVDVNENNEAVNAVDYSLNSSWQPTPQNLAERQEDTKNDIL